MERVFVGLDLHKEKIVTLGLPQEGITPILRHVSAGDSLSRLVKQLKRLSKAFSVEVCYEAGPCGYVPARALLAAGISCRIAAPSLVPRRPGDRIKTDARDALELALALRAGTLQFVRIPTTAEEEVRGLVRCREDVAKEVRRLKSIVGHWLLTRGHRTPSGVKRWTPDHWRWLRSLELADLDRTVLDHYLDLVLLLSDRLKQIEEQIVGLADTDTYRDRVSRLCALRGFSPLAAMRMIAEVMVFDRFSRASGFMKFTGLVPSEYSSSQRVHRGRITRAGNSHIRHLLVEAVQSIRACSRPGKSLLKRMSTLSGELREVAMKCLARLQAKFRKMNGRGLPTGKIRVALARELAGFVWAMMVHPAKGAEAVA